MLESMAHPSTWVGMTLNAKLTGVPPTDATEEK